MVARLNQRLRFLNFYFHSAAGAPSDRSIRFFFKHWFLAAAKTTTTRVENWLKKVSSKPLELGGILSQTLHQEIQEDSRTPCGTNGPF